jgi:hypothetical protein
MRSCRGCGDTNLSRILDLGKVLAAQQFPLATEPVHPEELSNPVVMDPCMGPASTAGGGTAWLRR